MNNETALKLLQQFVRTNTVTGNEKTLADELEKIFKAHNIPCEQIKYSEGRHQIVATLKGKEEGPTLGFSGHLDVVPVGEVEWEHGPFSADIEDGLLYGRGSCDMKSGLVAQVAAILRLQEEGCNFKGTIKMLYTVGEETSSIGAMQMTEMGLGEDLDALVIGEPTSLEVIVAHKGALWPEITTYGQTSHGAMPDLGTNAVDHMLILLDAFRKKFDFTLATDDILGHSTSSLNILSGGNGKNVVPDKCTANIDIRTVTSQDHNQMKKEITDLIEEVGKDIPDFKASVEFINDLPAVKTNKDDAFAKLVANAFEKIKQTPATMTTLKCYTDASAFVQSKNSFPIITIGPGSIDMAHQPNEFVPLQEFYDIIEIYKQLAEDFLQ